MDSTFIRFDYRADSMCQEADRRRQSCCATCGDADNDEGV